MAKNKRVIMMKGLPGSGKSTWAKEYVKKHKNFIRISNDDLRLQMFNRQFDKGDTKMVDKMRMMMLTTALELGQSVIIDNTNLSPRLEEQYRDIAKQHKAGFEIQDLTNVPIHTCLSQNNNRPNPVDPKVIWSMYNQFIAKENKVELVAIHDDLKPAYIFDMDGTLAIMDRNPYAWDLVDQDLPNPYVVHMAKTLSDHGAIIILSGRDGCCRDLTEKWLKIHEVPYQELHMRTPNDNRKDSVIKEELYRSKIQYRYNIMGVFDDRLQVCELWYSLGLPLFRVGDPNASF